MHLFRHSLSIHVFATSYSKIYISIFNILLFSTWLQVKGKCQIFISLQIFYAFGVSLHCPYIHLQLQLETACFLSVLYLELHNSLEKPIAAG